MKCSITWGPLTQSAIIVYGYYTDFTEFIVKLKGWGSHVFLHSPTNVKNFILLNNQCDIYSLRRFTFT